MERRNTEYRNQNTENSKKKKMIELQKRKNGNGNEKSFLEQLWEFIKREWRQLLYDTALVLFFWGVIYFVVYLIVVSG